MRWLSLFALVLATGMAAPAQGVAQDTRPGIAVMRFENGGSYGQEAEDFAALEVGLQQMLITEFAVNTQLRVVERGRIKELLEEQDLGTTGRVDAATAATVGKLVGARYVVLGGFVDFYGTMRLDARIVSVEQGEIVKAQRVRDKRENLYDMVVTLADQVTRGVNLPPLPAQAREERQERDIPEQAVKLYTKALLFEEQGNYRRAEQLYSQVVQEFPHYTEAAEALRQLPRG